MKKYIILLLVFNIFKIGIAQEIVSTEEIFKAIEKYDTITVKKYIDQGGDIDASFKRKVSISHKKKKKTSTNLLQEAIVSLTKANENRNQDLIFSAYRNFDILLSNLDKSKKRQEILDKTFATSISTSDIEIVRRLFQLGANINQKCELCQGRTPILIAIGYNKDIELIKFLLSLKPDLNILDNNGRSCLHYAAMIGNVELFEYLLKNTKIDINTKDIFDLSPISYAVINKKIEMYNYLLNKKALTNLEFKNGQTILNLAAVVGDVDFFKHIFYTSEIPLWSNKIGKVDPYRYASNEDIQIFIKRTTLASKGEKYLNKKLRSNSFKRLYLYE